MQATQQGMILGTAAYMSPEQAKGRTVDKRADVWAFGCVLYEMLTGRQSFGKSDVTESLAAVISLPPEWSTLPVNLHPRLLEAVERCLEKPLAKRYQDIGDVKIDIEKVLADPGGVIVQPVAAPVQAAPPSRLGWVAAAVFAVAAIVLGIGSWQTSVSEDRPLVRLNVDLGPGVRLAGNEDLPIAISPDGTRLAYVASVAGNPQRLFTRRLDQVEATELPGTDGARSPFFSTDGAWLGFHADNAVKKISVEGGTPLTVAEMAQSDFAESAWGEDGSIFTAGFIFGLVQTSDAGGESTQLIPLVSEESSFRLPQILPGGNAVLFTVISELGVGTNHVEVFSLDDGTRKTIVEGAMGARYLPTGHLVYFSDGTAFVTAFDLEALAMVGNPQPLINDVSYSSSGISLLTVSDTGTVVFHSGRSGLEALKTVRWLDAAGNHEPIIETPGIYDLPRLSPEAGRFAFTDTRRALVYNLDRRSTTPLTFDLGLYVSPTWTPSGEHVLLGVLGGTVSRGIYLASADGGGQLRHILGDGSGINIPKSLTNDGRTLVYTTVGDVYTVSIDGDADSLSAGEPERFLVSQSDDQTPRFSPDGGWIAYQSDESGRWEVSVRQFPHPATGDGARSAISNEGGVRPVWSPTTDELFYQVADQAGSPIMVVSYRIEGDRFIADRPRVWVADPVGLLEDMAPDGRALITVPAEGQTDDVDRHVVFLQNFFDEVTRRVPVP